MSAAAAAAAAAPASGGALVVAPRPPPVNYLAAALAPVQPKPRTPPPVKQEEVAPARTNKHGKPIGAFDPRKPKCALCSVNFTSEHGGKDANAGSHRHHHIYHPYLQTMH